MLGSRQLEDLSLSGLIMVSVECASSLYEDESPNSSDAYPTLCIGKKVRAVIGDQGSTTRVSD